MWHLGLYGRQRTDGTKLAGSGTVGEATYPPGSDSCEGQCALVTGFYRAGGVPLGPRIPVGTPPPPHLRLSSPSTPADRFSQVQSEAALSDSGSTGRGNLQICLFPGWNPVRNRRF